MKLELSAGRKVVLRCAGCARDLRLVGIEVDTMDRRREIQTFECDNCNAIQISIKTNLRTAFLPSFNGIPFKNSAKRLH